MSKLKRAGGIILFCLLLLWGGSVSAEPSAPQKDKEATPQALPAPTIAVVDIQHILEESLAAKSVQKQLEAQRAKVQTEIAGEEKDLRQAEQELVKSRNIDAPTVYAEKEQQLRQRFLGVERQVQSRRKALDQAFTDSMSVVRKTLQDTVKALAEERKANIVLIKQQALWSDKKLDLTEEALARLDKALPDVLVKVAPEDEVLKKKE